MSTKQYCFPVVKYRDGKPATFFRSKVVYAEQHEKVLKENAALRLQLEISTNEVIRLTGLLRVANTERCDAARDALAGEGAK